MRMDPAIAWDTKSDLAPILRAPRSFCPNKSVVGVHDYFSLNAQAHNSLYSELHQQFKLGVPRQQKPIKLAPIDHPVSPDTCVRLRFLKIPSHAKGHGAGALGDGIPNLLHMQHRPEGDPPSDSGSLHLQRIADDMQTLNAQIEEGLGGSREVKRMVDDLEKAAGAKADQFKALKLKAKEWLLTAYRTGELQKIASEMEAAEEAMIKKKQELLSLKRRASQGLIDAHRSGDLDKIFNDMEVASKAAEAAVSRSEYMADIKNRAKRGMLEAKRSGVLNQLVTGLDDARDELSKKGEELKSLKKKVKTGLLHAYRCGDLERIAENMEKEASRKAAEFRALKAKAARGLLEAKRNGQLDKMTADMEKAEQEMLETADKLKAMREGGKELSARQLENMAESMFKAGDAALTKAEELQIVRDKAKRAILQAKRDGHLEVLASQMVARADRMAAVKARCQAGFRTSQKAGDFQKVTQALEQNLREEMAMLKAEQHAAGAREDERAEASLKVQENNLREKIERTAELRKKCQRGVLDLSEIEDLEREIAELTDDFEVSAERFSATRKKAREELLAAKRNGQLEKIASEMEQVKLSIEEKDKQFSSKKEKLLELKKKAQMGIIMAKESGLLLQLAKEMEETAAEIMRNEMIVSNLDAEAKELAEKAMSDKEAQEKRAARLEQAELAMIKEKARKGLLQAKRTGELQRIAHDMDADAKADIEKTPDDQRGGAEVKQTEEAGEQLEVAAEQTKASAETEEAVEQTEEAGEPTDDAAEQPEADAEQEG